MLQLISLSPRAFDGPLESFEPVQHRLDSKSNYFIHDYLKLHGENIGRHADLSKVLTYHCDSGSFSISNEYKERLIADMVGLAKDVSRKLPNAVFIEKLCDWYRNATTINKQSVATDVTAHLSRKGNDIATMIMEVNPDLGRGSKKLKVLDIGGNDGKLTSYVSASLAEASGIYVEPYVLEVDTETGWDENSKTVQLESRKNCASVKKIIYDGTSMSSGKVAGSDCANPLVEGGKFDCVMYQHSLHHFPSDGVQQYSIKQAADLLKEGGVLSITEHSSRLSGDDIDLMHVVIELYKKLHEDPDISPAQLERTYNQYMEAETPANYMSQERLIAMATNAGFTPVTVTPTSPGPDNAYSINFVKGDQKMIEKTRQLENLVYPASTLKADQLKYQTTFIPHLTRSNSFS
ncbi:MAG: class I SAM-dependent methyltransferase [Pseudomonas sp.]|nr:class I SAM-dependent methyltransferase [Pseudomonas sp.]